MPESAQPSQTVFISYSHDNDEHRARVLHLANRLRGDGIDCDIDQYQNGAPPEGWPKWMNQKLDKARHVLVICTATYYQRVMGQAPPQTGNGVRFESTLMLNDFYIQGSVTDKFVPVIYDSADQKFIPKPLLGYTFYDFSQSPAYENLYRLLTGQPKVIKPKLGKRRRLEPQSMPPKEHPGAGTNKFEQEEKPARAEDASSNLDETTAPAGAKYENRFEQAKGVVTGEQMEVHQHFYPESGGQPPNEAGQTTGGSQTAAQLEADLERAHQEKEALEDAGQDTTPADTKIRQLKQQALRGKHLEAGELVGGERYRLEERLGEGGFAEVWKARDLADKRPVALKILHHQFCRDQTRRDRFFRGARVMAELRHQGVLPILERRGEDRGLLYFVMAYMSGGDLRRAVQTKRIKAEQTLPIIKTIGEALAYAHGQGLIHRDVKPANILLDTQGRAVLTDFDLVRAGDTTGGTRTGAMGTFLFAAPEAMINAAEVGPPADVFGLAMTALFLLNGGLSPHAFDSRIREGVIDQLKVGEAVKTVLHQGTAWEISDRYNQVKSFCSALEKALTTKPMEQTSKRVIESAGNQSRAAANKAINNPDAKVTPSKNRDTKSPVKKERPQIKGSEKAPRIGKEVNRVEADLDTRKPGDLGLFKLDSTITIRMRWIPPGTFMMGSPKSEKGRHRNEHQHEVTLSKGFWLGETQVTQALWQAVMGKNPSHFKGEKRPVETLSWDDAQDFLKALNQKAGDSYFRLPTEAEWEYACRTGTTTPFHTGNNLTTEQANYNGGYPYAGNPKGKDRGETIEVRQFRPNSRHLYDMHGNVWEWCQDWFGDYPRGPIMDPIGPEKGVSRVVRGGGWSGSAIRCRSAYRAHWLPGFRNSDLGLRLLKNP